MLFYAELREGSGVDVLCLGRSHVVVRLLRGGFWAGALVFVQATTHWHEFPLHVPPLAFANSSCAFINASFTSALCS